MYYVRFRYTVVNRLESGETLHKADGRYRPEKRLGSVGGTLGGEIVVSHRSTEEGTQRFYSAIEELKDKSYELFFIAEISDV